MANSDESMPRLEKLEASVASLNRAVVQVTEILIDQNQRIDRLGNRFEAAQCGTNERLDRLIELQTRSFTEWVGRHESHEQRLQSLEARVDRLEE
jgi:hypothetical protein